jgi:hypothetical protein
MGCSSSNAKGDEFRQNVISPNISALEAVKHMVYSASSESNHCVYPYTVDVYADVSQVCTTLVEEEVFTFKAG